MNIMSRKKVIKNEKLRENQVLILYVNIFFRFCKLSKLTPRRRYVSTNIRTKDLSSMVNIS